MGAGQELHGRRTDARCRARGQALTREVALFAGMAIFGIDLHRMGKTSLRRHLHTAQHRRTFSGVLRQPHQRQRAVFCCQPIQYRLGSGIAAVINDNARQTKRHQARQHRCHHGTVVITGDQHAGGKG